MDQLQFAFLEQQLESATGSGMNSVLLMHCYLGDLRHGYPASCQGKRINKNIGWHTFRHSFRTLLKANGEDVKTVPGALTARE